MPSALMLPDGMAPTNLHLRPSTKARYIDGDLLDICPRLAEISPRLYVVELVEGDKAVWAIMEATDAGSGMLVYKADSLDARVLERVRYMLHVPFDQRLKVIEAENAKYEADHADNLLEQTYERMGGQFRRQLEHDGFIDHRGVSYPKIGVAAPGRAR